MAMGKNGGCDQAGEHIVAATALLGGPVHLEDGSGSRIGEKKGSPSTWS